MNRVYFDNSATTKPSSDVVDAMTRALSEIYANPSSLHEEGLVCRKALISSKEVIENALGEKVPSENKLIVCGSGTEANNLAILGTAYAKSRNKGKRIITTNSEHPSVLRCCEKLSSEGFDVVYLSTKNGVVDLNELQNAVNSNTVLVSVMLVNNETGAEYPVKEAFKLAKKINPDIVTHTDATQGFLKTDFSVSTFNADLVTVSSHKIHGPKGIGALYVSPAVSTAKKLSPIIFGGGQENGMRSGTENLTSLIGFAEACKHKPDTDRIRELREYLISLLPDEVSVNQPLGKCAPHIISIRLPSIKSQTALNFLSSKGICVSSGSACSSRDKHISYALTAFGLSDKEADCSLRISLCEDNTKEEAEYFSTMLKEALHTLVRIK